MDPTQDLAAFAQLVMDAIKNGNGALIVALALMAVVSFVRKYAPLPFLKTRLGGWAALFVFATLGAIVTALAAGQALTGGLILTALGVGFGAAGGYEALKDFIPLLLKLFKDPIAEAEKAGEDAANAAPAGGVARVVPIRDVLASGSFGNITPEQRKAIADKLRAEGYIENPDGTFTREPK